MGLDTIGLVLDVEQEFDVHLTDAEVEHLCTVGDLHNWLCGELKCDTAQAGCATRWVWYRLLAAGREVWGPGRTRPRSASPIDAWLPERDQKRAWTQLSERLDWRLPVLVRPNSIQVAILAAALLALSVCVWGALLVNADWLGFGVVFGVLAAIGTAWLGAVWTRPLCTQPSAMLQDMRGLVLAVRTMNADKIQKAAGWSLNRNEVWRRMTYIVADWSGLPAEDVRPEQSFLRDFA